jgi:hypothetical protein
MRKLHKKDDKSEKGFGKTKRRTSGNPNSNPPN